MSRGLIKALAIVVVFAAALAVGGYFYLRQSLPEENGTIEVAGPTAPIEIIRDADDIPHIFAATKLDAYFGLGYAHAQDRLWQMEFQRRIGNGRLSEIFGEATLPEDRFLRTVGFGRAARAAWMRLPDAARTQIDAYVAGVNAFIATHHGGSLPPEFSLLRFEPEPWSGQDVLVWVKMMAWDLSANYTYELMRYDIAARVGPDRMADLLPPYPRDGLNILGSDVVAHAFQGSGAAGLGRAPDSTTKATRGVNAKSPDRAGSPDRAYSADSAERVKDRGSPIIASQDKRDWSASLARGLGEPDSAVRDFLFGSRIEALGSNNWVVDGTLTASGKPLLANDPHLATHIPSLWYLAQMSAGDFDVVGATLPGTPAVAIGRNRFIAWGETNVAADVEDLYREHLDPGGMTAEFRGLQEPLRVIRETIAVKGAATVTLNVRLTRHGPLVSDAMNATNAEAKPGTNTPPREPLAFRWTALDDDDGTILAFLRLNEARNWRDFTGALRDFVVPAQNFVYADVDGHIGYYAPGRVPIRAHGDGSSPAEGWTGDAEWTGWIPFDALPHAFDPPAHFIVTANNRPVPADYPYLISLEYPNSYRAQRITALLQQRTKLTPNDFRTIQADTFSPHAQELLPHLLDHVQAQDAADKSAVDVLKHWNLDARADSAAPAIFEAWFLRLAPTIAGDELGELAMSEYQGRFSYVTRFVMNVLSAAPRPDVVSGAGPVLAPPSPGTGPGRTSESPWCDDVRTTEHETCDEEVTKALHEGVAMLARQLGPDQARWRWDGVHRAVFPHQGLDTVPVLHPLLSRSVPNGGDWSTVNVGPVNVDHPFDQISIPGYRQIVDLSPANDSRFLDAVGQSGHFLSKHYDDFLKDWHDVAYRRMRMERADIERDAIGHLRLVPK